MKTILTSLFLVAAYTLWAQSSEYAGVEQAVKYYLDGGTNNDFETLSKAFHSTATMRFVTEEGYREVNALNFFKERMKPGPPQNRKTRVENITVSGTAANARLEIEYPTFTFIDYMNLLKIDGEWKIVSKIFHRRVHQEGS